MDDLKGKRTAYYQLLDHYKDQLSAHHGNSIDSLIRAEFPRLVPGSVASAFHPLIHVGYGWSVGDPTTVVEGLAYMHHSYAPFKFSREPALGSGTQDAFAVLDKLRANDKIVEEIEASMQSDRAKAMLFPEPIVRYIMFTDRGDVFLDYVEQIR